MPCLPNGNYYFTSQADVDNFQVYYPGCTELEGDVIISGEDITHLDGLSVITSIGGSLRIGEYFEGNPLLTDLTGLEGLISIGRDLNIGGNWQYGNPSLTSLTGLDNLVSIGWSLGIEGNKPWSV